MNFYVLVFRGIRILTGESELKIEQFYHAVETAHDEKWEDEPSNCRDRNEREKHHADESSDLG